MTLPLTLSATLGGTSPVSPPPPVVPAPTRTVVVSRDWSVFDPRLRIDSYSGETMHTVTVTYLPTGMQESCGKYPHQIQNRTEAIAKLRVKVAGTG